jgi:hypothetical protein
VAYIKPEYSKGEVNRAGEVLITNGVGIYERNDALKVINNWRYSHIYPMQKIKATLDRRARKIDPSVVTAQRLKRLPSIESKLQILGNSKLARMQDIGGCRAILETVDEVNELRAVYEEADAKSPAGRPKLKRVTDYVLDEPRETGYRSVHLLFDYQSTNESRKIYSGLQVEIQLRTRLQHTWATAVETASTFLGEKLKSGIGDRNWLRFFALASSFFALKESCPLVPNTPTQKRQLLSELRKYWKMLNVDAFLGSCVITADVSSREFNKTVKKNDRIFLKLNAKTRELGIKVFPIAELNSAAEEIALAEMESIANPEIDAVLVEVDSLMKLKIAYPNYYADTTEFVEIIGKEMGGERWKLKEN